MKLFHFSWSAMERGKRNILFITPQPYEMASRVGCGVSRRGNVPRVRENAPFASGENDPKRDKHMDTDIIKLSGQKLSLKENLSEAVKALQEDGCLVLKKATNVDLDMSGNADSLAFIKRHIVLNEVNISS
jgi:hypothetical protein